MMDASSLPDDPRDWPTDPFALLGVPRSVGESELKRAYTRLIRKYKPEHAPDEFRRIRGAYEAAIEMSRWYRDAPPVRETFHDLPFPAVAPTPEAPTITPPIAPRETQIDPPVRPTSGDPVDAAWADAVAGYHADAYSALATLAEQDPHRIDLPLRLYWLLALRPALDDARTRHDWLAAALTRARLRGPAVELYRRELAADPSTALDGPYRRLLELPGASGRDVLAVANARLAVAATDGRWALLDIDLAALAHRAPDLDDGAWLGYLTDLTARASGDRPPLLEQCRALLAGLRHLELSHGWAFDQLEHRQALFVHLNATRIPDPIRRALAAAEAGDGAAALAAAVAWAAADPCAALRACDVATIAEQGRAMLADLARRLANRAGRRAEYPSGLVRGLVRSHLSRAPVRVYALARSQLLPFLLAERIDPQEVIDVCSADPHLATRELVHDIRNDTALQLVYRLASADG